MYGNNFRGPFIPQKMTYGPMMRASAMPMMGIQSRTGLGGGLRSLLGLGGRNALTGARTFNFSSLLGNASKALNVVNQAIPIVKEVGPMVNNMRSMIKIASIFKDETDTTPVRTQKNTSTSNTNESQTSNITKESDTISSTTISQKNNNEPNFFL